MTAAVPISTMNFLEVISKERVEVDLVQPSMSTAFSSLMNWWCFTEQLGSLNVRHKNMHLS